MTNSFLTLLNIPFSKGNLRGKDAEIARLKKELRKAKMENEILKKATAIFAQTSQ